MEVDKKVGVKEENPVTEQRRMPGAGGQPPQRTTFRPPWVKDGPSPLPMPSAPWTLNSRRDSKAKDEEPPPFAQVTLKVSLSFLTSLRYR